MALLHVKKVSKSFGGVVAVSELSFEIEAGEMVGLIGANGAGKTTLFSLIAGSQRPTSGAIEFNGVRVDRLTSDRVCRLGIARTFQIVRPFRGLTVFENVQVAALFGATQERSMATAGERAHRILSEVGLAHRANDLASDMTLAGHKRLQVARALATGPQLLMLDEVLSGLTPTEVEEAVLLVRKLHKEHGLTILMVEHVLRAVMQLCPRILVLHNGRLIAEGSPETVSSDPAVIEAYLGAADETAVA